ncbi:MAG: thioredoxin domain-containing protein [Nanoarchaeota archaeon]
MKDEHKKEDHITIKKPSLKNKWMLSTVILGIIAIILLVMVLSNGSIGGVSQSKLKPQIESFVNTQLIQEGGATVTDIKTESGLYVATVSVDGEAVPLYFTKDGKFINQGTPLTPINGDGSATNPDDSGNIPTPGDTIVQASVDDDAVLGSPTAKVTIVEFSDFQCPFCEKFYSETFSQLKTNYIDTGKVKLVFRDFPLTQLHPMAQKSAEATECTRAKGGDTAFWKMHDKIFENQGSLSIDNLKKWSKEIGYNIDTCLDSGEKAAEVNKDAADGDSYGVTGTPSFFINGRVIEGAYPYASFQQVIDEELAK